MFFSFLVFAFFSISPVVSTQWDPFTFNITITCRLFTKTTYWYSVQFLEEDVFSSGEWITQKFEERYYPATVRRIFHGAMDGDEILSIRYSVTAIFFHDCMQNGEVLEAQFEFQKECELRKPCYMAYDVDLTDKYGFYKAENGVRQ